MLIVTAPRRGRRRRAHANKNPAPAPSVDIEVVLHHPAVGDLKVPPIHPLVADCGHDPCRLSGFEDDHNLIRLGAAEVGLDKFVAATLWRLDDWSIPAVGLLLPPLLELFGGPPRHIAADPKDPP